MWGKLTRLSCSRDGLSIDRTRSCIVCGELDIAIDVRGRAGIREEGITVVPGNAGSLSLSKFDDDTSSEQLVVWRVGIQRVASAAYSRYNRQDLR